MSLTLYDFKGNFRGFKALIAAEYNGVSVTVSDFTEESKAMSPLGKAPVLSTPQGAIFESNAIARHIARMNASTELMGSGFLAQSSVDSWVDFAAHELELPACMWTYPVLGHMPYNAGAYAKAKEDLGRGFATLDKYLLDRTFLVGDKVTLADICVVSAIVYPMKLVCTKEYLKPYTNLQRYFNTCVNQPAFKAVIGDCPLAKDELLAEGAPKPVKVVAAKVEKPKEEKKAAKKDDHDDDDDEPKPEKKADHPYKIMDSATPSPFLMDAWKKTYSNCHGDYASAMKYFWENFDQKGWSLWHMIYKYNEENKRIFMAGNAITGFHQRTDEVRKWAFGVQDLLGEEPPAGVLEICGVWLLRGDTVEHMCAANDDANWYAWTKIAGGDMTISEENKKMVADYWCSDEKLEGKVIQDSKVFK
jgi:elongation factor 1-gamma